MRKTLFQTYRKEFIILFVICGIVAAITGFILIAALITFFVYYYSQKSKVKSTDPVDPKKSELPKKVKAKKDDDLQIDEYVDPEKLGPPETVKKLENKDPFRNIQKAIHIGNGVYAPVIDVKN